MKYSRIGFIMRSSTPKSQSVPIGLCYVLLKLKADLSRYRAYRLQCDLLKAWIAWKHRLPDKSLPVKKGGILIAQNWAIRTANMLLGKMPELV